MRCGCRRRLWWTCPTLACLRLGLLLISDEHGRYVLMVNGPNEHDPGLELEIAGLDVHAAQAVHARLGELRRQLNVYRGHMLNVTVDPMGGVVLEFGEVPSTAREDVVLPESVLGRVERHALGVAAHRDALLAAGQHLKRGLLLYGPPGTGKTHTTRYMVARMTGYTRLILTGRALHAIGPAAELARDLQPTVIVLEDVDLVAEDRSFGPGSSPVLFDLLDAMDGAAPDADLLFVLTTTELTCLSPRSRRVRGASTSRSRSTSLMPRLVNSCSRSTAARFLCAWVMPRPARSSSAPKA